MLEGPNGCMPCVGGAGTNYWSMTYLTGSTSTTKPDTEILGWLDHQWVSSSIRNPFMRATAAAMNTFYTAPQVSWIWLTLQVSPDLQYMVAMQLEGEAAVAQLFAADAPPSRAYAVCFTKGSPLYDVLSTIQVLETWQDMARMPSRVRVSVDGTTYILQTFIDGRVTLSNGSINQEAIAVLFDAAGTEQLGLGFIEGNNLHPPRETMTHMMALAGINAPTELFLPKRAGKAASAESLAFFIGIVLLFFALLALIIWGIVFAVQSGRR